MSRSIKILYGKKGYSLSIKKSWKTTVIRKPKMPLIKSIDKAVTNAFLNPINSPSLSNLAKDSKSACILVCDITRPVPNNLFLEKLVNTLVISGISEDNIIILIATGLHRPATKSEINQIIGSNWVIKNISITRY